MNIQGVRKLVNLRDLGGYPTMDGRTVKSGHFYRSAGLFLLNDQELEVIRNLKLKVILDLRTKLEYEEMPDPTFEGVKVLQYSGLVSRGSEGIDFSPNGMKQIGQGAEDQLNKLKGYYRQIAFENEAYQKMFYEIQTMNTPILFHCAYGKDRTGVAAMLILLFLGVSEEVIMEDYLLSNEYLAEIIEEEMLKEKDNLEKHPEMKELMTMLYGVSENMGLFVLERIHEKYENLDDFFDKEFNIDKEQRKFLQDYYLE